MAFYYLCLLLFATEEGRLCVIRAARRGRYIVKMLILIAALSVVFAAFASDGFADCDLTFVTDEEVTTEMVTPSGLGILIGIGAECVEEMPEDFAAAVADGTAAVGKGKGTRDIGRDGLTIYMIEA